MCFGCTVQPDNKETELGSSDQEASLSAGRNTGMVLVPYYAWEYGPAAISGGVVILSPWLSSVRTDEISVRFTKNISRVSVS